MYSKIIIFLIGFSLFYSCKKDVGGKSTLLGYTYDVLREGNGVKPKDGDHVLFNNITMVNDSILEDTHIFPFQPAFRVEVNPPREVLAILDVIKVMKEGDSVLLHIPIDSLPFATIEFQSYKELKHLITLDKVISKEEYDLEMSRRQEFVRNLMDSLGNQDAIKRKEITNYVRDYNNGVLNAQLKTTDKGVKYLVLKEGTGSIPQTGDIIEVNYVGALKNEAIFDASFSKRQPYVYRSNTGQVIKGWDHLFTQLKEGTEAIAIIPPDLAYGATGESPLIPPDAELIFYLNLFKVRPFPK